MSDVYNDLLEWCILYSLCDCDSTGSTSNESDLFDLKLRQCHDVFRIVEFNRSRLCSVEVLCALPCGTRSPNGCRCRCTDNVVGFYLVEWYIVSEYLPYLSTPMQRNFSQAFDAQCLRISSTCETRASATRYLKRVPWKNWQKSSFSRAFKRKRSFSRWFLAYHLGCRRKLSNFRMKVLLNFACIAPKFQHLLRASECGYELIMWWVEYHWSIIARVWNWPRGIVGNLSQKPSSWQ